MDKFPPPTLLRQVMTLLLIPTVLLPVGIALLFVFARFFAIFGDPVSAGILDVTAIGFFVLWFLCLVAQLIAVVCVVLHLSGVPQDEAANRAIRPDFCNAE